MNSPTTTWSDSGSGTWPVVVSAPGDVAPGVGRLTVFAYCAAAFLIGLVRSWTIQLVGAMPVGELILLAVVGHAVVWAALTSRLPAPLPSPRLLGIFALCQVLALISYVVTDLWRESAPVDMIRGWLRMVFVLIDLGGLALLFGATERTFAFLQLGASFSFVTLLITPPTFGEYWKFGFAYPVTTLVLLLAPRFLGYWGAPLGCMALGVLNALLDFRSLGAICLGLGALLLIRALPKIARKVVMIVGGVIVLAASPLIFEKMFADTGGRADRSNVERLAMLTAAWEGFAKSPLIGQGSWFSKSDLMDNFLLIRSEKAHAAGGGMQFDNEDFEGIAIHSQILVTLAEAGIFGGLFFFVYGVLIAWAMWFALGDAAWHWTLPSRIFILATSFWDLGMSPFSGPVRVNIALTALLIVLFWRERSRQRAGQTLPLI